MAILSLTDDVLPFLQKTADDSYNNISTTQNAVEQFVKSYCDRDLEETTYVEKQRWGSDGMVRLDQRPVTSVDYVMSGEVSAMWVKNSNASTTATVAVASSGLSLKYNGVATSGNFTFATNTTITSLVSAINTAGSGWSAGVYTGYGDYQSAFLLPWFGRSAINSASVSLFVPMSHAYEYEMYDADEAIIDMSWLDHIDMSWQITNRPTSRVRTSNVYVKYTAGYSSSTMPKDLEYAILILIGHLYSKATASVFGVEACKVGDYAKTYSKDAPKEALAILSQYKDMSL